MFYCEQKLSAILLCLVIIEFREILEIGNKELQHDVKNYSGSCLDSLQKSKVSQILSSSPNNVFKKRFEFGKNGNISLEPETFKIRTAHMKQKREHDCSEQNVDALRYIFLNGWKYKLSEFISLKIFNDKNTTRSLFNKCFRSTIPHIVALTTLVLYSVFSCLKSGFAPSSEPEIKPQKSYYSVFEFRCKPFLELTVYYFSLKKYLNEIDRKSDKNIGRMNHEWARYESFKTFPEESAVSSLRLAQAGFYFSGKGEEAVCFFCGLSNGKWTNKESVIELHKRLSPKCKFINGERTENVPIHGNGESEQNYGGACGGPEDFSENNTTRETEQIEHIQYSSEITRTRNEVSQQTEQNLEQTNTTTGNTYQNTLENERHSILQNGSSGQYSEYRPPEEIKRFPGITNEQPKHPDYATRSVRLSSFSQWQLGHVMKPEDLAEAGFFFCGMQDLVRCFFCGGGMKNWEYGDSPWIEHARWFPTCAYLKQCKGEDFVNLCQISNMTFSTQTNFQLRDLDSQQANIVEDQYITDLNSIAAKRVLDMGYMQAQVEDAIRSIRQRIGSGEELKAQNILEYLLDNSFSRSNASATTMTPGQHSNTTRNRGQLSPNSRQSNVAIDTTERTSPQPSADKTPTATKDERKSLKEENRHLKEQTMCKICMDKDANIVFLPCGHLVSCVECAHALRKCAVCRTVIQGTVRAYPA